MVNDSGGYSVQHIRKRIVCQTNDKSDARLLLPATSPGADLTAAEPIFQEMVEQGPKVAGAFFDGDLSRREGRGSHLLAAAKDHQMARQEIKRCRAEIACQGLHLWSLFRCIALPSCAFCVRSPFSA